MTFVLIGLCGSAFAESAGCTTANGGGFNASVPAAFPRTGAGAASQFEQGEVITMTVHTVGGLQYTFMELGMVPGGGSDFAGAPVDNGESVSVTINADGAYAPTWSMGEPFGPGDINGSTLTFACSPVVKPTTTTLASSLNPSQFGDSVTFTATVAAASGSGTPTGNVVFTIDGAAQPAIALDANGRATLAISSLSVGNHTVQATYSGSSSYTGSSSSPLGQVINPATITLASSLNPSQFGDPVTFTATVAATGGSGTPTGNVVFTIDGAAQPAMALDASGRATLTTSTLSVGSHVIQATYSGSSSLLTQVVSAASARQTATSVTSSLNPSKLGEAITFTAAVVPTSGAGIPTGDVTFTISGAPQPIRATLDQSGTAAVTMSDLSVGTHTVTATYGGDTAFAASTSPALSQVVEDDNQDSQDLRQMQIITTKIVAQTSGQSMDGAIGNAIDEGFSDSPLVTATSNSMRFNFAAEPPASTTSPATAGPPDPLRFGQSIESTNSATGAAQAIDASLGQATPRQSSTSGADTVGARWRPWLDIRGTGWESDDANADIEGSQLNALAGISYKINPRLLVGLFAGYEDFSYSSVPLDATMDGDGWTAGAYLGWKLAPALRFDAGLARSAIDYSGTAGTANGEFDGERWFFTSGLTGTQPLGDFVIEPSAKVYVLWEKEGAYTDSLGTLQPERDFSTGRASGGLRLSYPIAFDDMKFVPFAGIYGDYYFSEDDEAATLTFDDVIEDGWSARLTGGFALAMPSGLSASFSGEFGGIGSDTHSWSGRAGVSIPF